MLDTGVNFYAALSNPLRNLEVKVTYLEISNCLKCFIHITESSEIIHNFIVFMFILRGIIQSNFHRVLQKVN